MHDCFKASCMHMHHGSTQLHLLISDNSIHWQHARTCSQMLAFKGGSSGISAIAPGKGC